MDAQAMIATAKTTKAAFLVIAALALNAVKWPTSVTIQGT